MSNSTDQTPAATADPTPPHAPMKNGRHDVVTHRLVVIALGLTVVFTGLNVTVLQFAGREPNAALSNLGSVAIGALAMCLASIMRPQ